MLNYMMPTIPKGLSIKSTENSTSGKGENGMKVEKNRVYLFVCIVLVAGLLLGVAGCSKEAKLERHWKKGETYFTENKFKEAIIEYKNVIKLKPDHAQAYYKLGL